MKIKFTCPKCLHNCYADAYLSDTVVSCPVCLQSITVPLPERGSLASTLLTYLSRLQQGEWEPIQPEERPRWRLAVRGLYLEMIAVALSFAGLALVPIWATICIIIWENAPRESIFLPPTIVFIVTYLISIIALLLCAATPGRCGLAALGSGVAMVLTLLLAIPLSRWPSNRDPTFPRICGWLVVIAGAIAAELLLTLYLHEVAARFGITRLAKRILIYFAITAVILTGFCLMIAISLLQDRQMRSGVLPAWGIFGCSGCLVLLLRGWRYFLNWMVRELIRGALLHSEKNHPEENSALEERDG